MTDQPKAAPRDKLAEDASIGKLVGHQDEAHPRNITAGAAPADKPPFPQAMADRQDEFAYNDSEWKPGAAPADEGMVEEPKAPPDGWPMSPHIREWMRYAFALRARCEELAGENKRICELHKALMKEADRRLDESERDVAMLKAAVRDSAQWLKCWKDYSEQHAAALRLAEGEGR